MAETQEFKIFYLGEEDYSKSADVPEQTKKTAESIEKTLKEKVNAKLKLLNDNINNLVKSVDEKISEKAFTTETGNKLELEMDENTFILTAKLLDKNNNVLSTKQIDLPLETMVVGATYNNENKNIVLTLKNGQEVSFGVGDLVSGLISTDQLNTALNGKVGKEEGKGLSANDFTNEEKNKLAGIDEGAQVNVINKILVNGVEQQINEDKSVSIEITNTGVSQDYVDNLVGDINSILDEVNGEVI